MKGRNVESLGELVALVRSAAAVETLVQDVAVLFAPRGIIYFSHHCLNAPIGSVKAIVKADRIEAVPAIAQVS